MNEWVEIIGGAWLAMGLLHWYRIGRWSVRIESWRRINWLVFVAWLPVYLLFGPIGLAFQEWLFSDEFNWWKLTDEELAERRKEKDQ